MNYEEALAYWFARVNFEQSAPQAADLKLDRMRSLLAALGDPQDGLRIVHVAGSKGKGSTAAMLAAVLEKAGHRTGLFTSPHLCRVEERIQINREPVAPAELTELVGVVRKAIEGASGPPPTFFEVATALGFLHFARRRVDVAVVEVGLGGRLDSTNVCSPLVALVTSISIDHTQQLGDSVAAIAFEKAGIVKPGRPTLSGATAPAARAVIEEVCRRRGAPLGQLGVDFRYRYEPGRVVAGPRFRVHDSRVQVTTTRRAWPALKLRLLGEHQAANAAVAVACIEELRDRGLSVDDEAVAGGLANVAWPARLEVLRARPLVVLDCAHNLASVQALLETLDGSFPKTRLRLIFGTSSDKDLPGMLRLLAPRFAHAYWTRARSPRGVPPEQVAAALPPECTLPFSLCPTPEEAWRRALADAGPDELICVTGSVFLAGSIRPLALGDRAPTLTA
jgi:dihydrofolate synthase/folylpolyglutamate synthase